MQRVLEASSGQGPQVLIEVDDTRIESFMPAAEGDAQLEGGVREGIEKLREIGDTIGEACRSINAAVAQRLGDAKPAEFTLEFGVKIGAEGGAIISKVTGEAALKVTATWRTRA